MFKGWGRGRAAVEAKAGAAVGAVTPSTKVVGDSAEQRALLFLQQQGLRLVCRNYRLAGGPRQRGAEIDLIMQAPDGTLVFVEVRARRSAAHGGAAASVLAPKQRRIVRAAQHYLMSLATLPPCRFDVVAVDREALQWLQAAFDAG